MTAVIRRPNGEQGMNICIYSTRKKTNRNSAFNQSLRMRYLRIMNHGTKFAKKLHKAHLLRSTVSRLVRTTSKRINGCGFTWISFYSSHFNIAKVHRIWKGQLRSGTRS